MNFDDNTHDEGRRALRAAIAAAEADEYRTLEQVQRAQAEHSRAMRRVVDLRRHATALGMR